MDEDLPFAALIVCRDPGRLGFCTIGPTPIDRFGFWCLFADAEGRKRCTQNRVIVELPFEIAAAGRLATIRRFCKIFEEKSLPYRADTHEPTEKNNPRGGQNARGKSQAPRPWQPHPVHGNRKRTPCSSASALSMKALAALSSASACSKLVQSIACVKRWAKSSIRTSGSALCRLEIAFRALR